MTYELLMEECAKYEVEVHELDMTCKGLYADGIIAISSRVDTTAEKLCILAEEFGHHMTSMGNILNQNDPMCRKQEIRARRYGIKKILPVGKIVAALESGARGFHEAAEYIGVTEKYLRDAFDLYARIYGDYIEVDGKVLYFDPPGLFTKLID